MILVYGEDDRVSEWVLDKLKYKDKLKEFVAIGLEDAGELICGVLYRNFNGHDIHMDIATTTPRWCTARTLAAFFGYPFDDLGCVRVTAQTSSSNKRTHSLVERLGFVKEGVLRCAVDGKEDIWVYGMLKSECKWL